MTLRFALLGASLCAALPLVEACGSDPDRHPEPAADAAPDGDAGANPDSGDRPDSGEPPEKDGGNDAAPDSDVPDADAAADGATEGGGDGDGGGGSDGDAGPPSPTWFESDTPLEFALSGPIGDAFRAAFAGTPDGIVPPLRVKDPFAANAAFTFLDQAVHDVAVELSVRGNSSLQECPFPKLKLAFDQRVVDSDNPLVGTKKIKIGTHCGEDEATSGTIGRLRHEKAAWREETVYRLARALGITIMQTRLAVVTYSDTSADAGFESPLTRKAFLLEHVDELARRLGGDALKDPVDCGPDPAARPDPEAVLRVRFFHAMVGNWDFELGPPETGGCGNIWNTEVLVHPGGKLTLVPTDFDLAAFVVGEVRNPDTNQLEPIDAVNAKASARGYLTEFLAGQDPGAVAAMKAEYLSKKAALAAVVDGSPIDDAGKQRGKLLLDGFFAALEE